MKLQVIIGKGWDPYWNLSVENYLLEQPVDETVTMYLWHNRRTVVIGRNQNPFAECNVEALVADGGYLSRRMTGGGAVYHDEGNMNFSFVAPHSLYDQLRQFEVMRQAVASYGLSTELSGRNDVLCDGRKFSGNAFHKGRNHGLHHGTVLIGGNVSDMQRYLKAKPSKLQRHGVSSVRSRVVNLSELADVTVQNLMPRMVEAFEAVYGGKAVMVDYDAIMQEEFVRRQHDVYASDEWLYGRWRNFESRCHGSWDWGDADVSLTVDESLGRITSAVIASDSLHPEAVTAAEQLLAGARVDEPPVFDHNGESGTIINDIISLIYK